MKGIVLLLLQSWLDVVKDLKGKSAGFAIWIAG